MTTNVPYRVVNGIRHLDPYWVTFSAYKSKAKYAKHDWTGKKLRRCFFGHFMTMHNNYPIVAIKMGRILINGKQMTDPEYRIRKNDVISHISHLHEPPILNLPIEILYNNINLLVVNKPPSIPVHPCTQYRIHTVVGMLWAQYGMHEVRVLHRLDRGTSGVLIFSRNYKTDQELKEVMRMGNIRKEYVCKVEGVFPDREVVCDQPIGPVVKSLGIQCVKDNGKPAKSTFKRLWTDGENSVVSAIIETGRTHQIRVHLQYLGYPILNDFMYNSTFWGPNKGRGAVFGRSFAELIEEIEKEHLFKSWGDEQNPEYEESMFRLHQENLKPEDLSNFGYGGIANRPNYDTICFRCNVKRKLPTMDYLRMFLHCKSYESDKFYFEAPLPDWAIKPQELELNKRVESIYLNNNPF